MKSRSSRNFGLFVFHLVAVALCFSRCAPKVYLIDRQTVLELEASGDWQELDQKFHQNQLASGPLPLEKTHENVEARSLFSMTHADSNKSKDSASSAADSKKSNGSR